MPSQLAAKIRAKYPGAYDDMDDAALEKSVLAKHPEYQDLATPQTQAGTTPVSASEPGTYWGGVKKSLIDQATHAATGSTDASGLPSVHAASPAVEKFANTPIAQPTGNATIDGFLSPASLAMMAAGGLNGRGSAVAQKLPISGTLRAGASLLEGAPSSLRKWVPLAEAAPEHLRNAAQWAKDAQMGVARGAEQYQMPRTESVVDRPPRAPQMIGEGGSSTAPDLSRPVPAGSLTPAEMQARSDAVKAAGGLPPQQASQPSTQPTVGQLRMATGQGGQSSPTLSTPVQGVLRPAPMAEPTAIPSMLQAKPTTPPVQVDQASLPADWKTSVPDKVGHALDPARVDIGAEQAGRATGMTKQQVRDVATPILDSAPGEASPILPEAALKRIVDTLKGLPKGGPEREAYVAKATSGKTQWQVENIRRTLEHLGLIVPVAAAAGGTLRDAIMKRLRGSEQPGQQLDQ